MIAMEKIFLNLHVHSHKVEGRDSTNYVNDIPSLKKELDTIKTKSIISFTNHDVFYHEFHKNIKKKNNNSLVKILPGAELSFNDLRAHCLIIVDEKNIKEFNDFMESWTKKDDAEKTFENFLETWDKKVYGILIFHYDKNDNSININSLVKVVESIDSFPLEVAVEGSNTKARDKTLSELANEGLDYIPIFYFFDDDLKKSRSRPNYNLTTFLGENSFKSLFLWIRTRSLFNCSDSKEWLKKNDEKLGSLKLIIGERATGKSKLLQLLSDQKKKGEENLVYVHKQGKQEESLNEEKFVKKLKDGHTFFKSFEEDSWNEKINSINIEIKKIIENFKKINKIEKEDYAKKLRDHFEKFYQNSQYLKYKILDDNSFIQNIKLKEKIIENNKIENDEEIREFMESSNKISVTKAKLRERELKKLINLKKKNEFDLELIEIDNIIKKILYTENIQKCLHTELKKFKYNPKEFKNWLHDYYISYKEINLSQNIIKNNLEEIEKIFNEIKLKEITPVSERIDGKYGIYRSYTKKNKDILKVIEIFSEGNISISNTIKKLKKMEDIDSEFKFLKKEDLPYNIGIKNFLIKDSNGKTPSGSERSAIFIKKDLEKIPNSVKYVFLDEIDNALDARTIRETYKEIFESLILDQRKNIYLITHNFKTAFLFPVDKIYLTRYKQDLDRKEEITISDFPLKEWEINLEKNFNEIFSFFEENEYEWNRRRIIYGRNN